MPGRHYDRRYAEAAEYFEKLDAAQVAHEKGESFPIDADEQRRRRRRSYNNSPYPYSDRDDAIRALSGAYGPGWWSSRHDEEALHNTGWNYIAIHAKAKLVMACQLKVRRRLRGGTVTKAATPGPEAVADELPPNHPLVRLLENPNPRFGGEIFRYQIEQQKCLTGGALVYVILNQLGLPYQLWVLPVALCRPMPPSPEFPEGSYFLSMTGTFAQQAYAQWGIGAMAGMTIDARSVIRVGWPHPVYFGDWQSPLAAMSLQIDIGEEVDRATLYAMQNEVDASMVLSVVGSDVSDTEIEAIQSKINAAKAGTRNRGKVFVMKGVEATKTGRTASELDFVNGREQAIKIGLATHGVAPIATGMQEAGAYAAYYAALLQTAEVAVRPDLRLIAGALTQYLAPYFNGDEVIEMEPPSINDPDVAMREVQTLGSAITINEARAKFKYPPVPWGDVPFGTNSQPPAPAAGQEGDNPVLPGNDTSKQGPGTTGIRHPALRAVLNNLPSRNGSVA